MKFRNTWLLLGIAVLFGLYIYFIEFKKAAQDAETKEASEKVMTFEPAKIRSVVLKNEHGEFQLDSTDGTSWNLKVPVAAKADNAAVNGMLTALSTEKFDDSLEPDATGDASAPGHLKSYGLDQPKESITITSVDGKTQKVNVGNDTPLPGKTYLQRDGEKKVLLGLSGFKTQLSKDQKDLRDKTVFKKSRNDVTKVTMTYNNKQNKGVINLTKGKDGWLLGDVDQNMAADVEVTGAFLTNIENLKATDFASEKGDDVKEIKKYGLDKPDMTIAFEGEKGHLVTLSFSAKKDNAVYVKSDDAPTIYSGFVSSVDQLYHKFDDFRDRKLPFTFKKEDVNEVVIKTSLVNIDVAKKGTAWEVSSTDASNSSKQANQGQIESLLGRLAGLRINEFLDKKEKPQGLVPIEKQITLKDAKGQEVFNMVWGEKTKSGKNYFVKTSQSPQVVGVEASAIDQLPLQTVVEPKVTATPTSTLPASAASGSAAKPPPPARELPHVVDPGAAAPQASDEAEPASGGSHP